MTGWTSKLALAAALAAAAGAGAWVATTQAENPQYAEGVWPTIAVCRNDFTKHGPRPPAGQELAYACTFDFRSVCKQGYDATEPKLSKLGPRRYRLRYECSPPVRPPR